MRARSGLWALVAVPLLLAFSASASETTTYAYDALGRLISVTESDRQVAVTYDAAGNRTDYEASDEPTTLSISNASVTEGGQLSFSISRSGFTGSAVSASYTTSNGTALSGSDYNAVSSVVNFAPGQVSKVIKIDTIDDHAVEGAETMTVTLSNPTSNVVLGTSTGTGTITDNDVGLSIGNASATEGGALSFTVTRTGVTNTAVDARYDTSNITAISTSDYEPASDQRVYFAAGQTSQVITIQTTNDSVVESTETMKVTLSSPNPSSTVSIISATGTGTIADNDASLSIGNASATEGGTLSFTVTRTGVTNTAVDAAYATSNVTASSASDYTAASDRVYFAAGQTSQVITIQTTNDSVVESTETMKVTLSSPSANTAIGTATGTGTITDNDASLSIGNASATEGGTLSFTVTRTGVTNTAVDAAYATSNVTASSASDYTAASDRVYFAAGETSQVITIQTTNDSVVESTETMKVTLSSPSANTAIGTATGTGTISDNDASLAIGNASATEGGTLSFTVTRSGITSSAVSASYATANITASAGSDYTATSGTVSFAAGQTSKVISVITLSDSLSESSETMKVTLTNPSANTAIAAAIGTGTIINNSPPVAVNDSASGVCGNGAIVNLTANDTDAEGHYPLTLASIVLTSGNVMADANIYSASSVIVAFGERNTSSVFTYTVKDSLGASSTGTLTLSSTATMCV